MTLPRGEGAGPLRLLQSRAYLFVTFLLLYKPVCVSDLPALAALDRAWDAARYLAVGAGLLVWLIFYRSLSSGCSPSPLSAARAC